MPLVDLPDHCRHQLEMETKKTIEFIVKNFSEYSDTDIVNILSQALLCIFCNHIIDNLEEEEFNADHEIDDFFNSLRENFLIGIQNLTESLKNQDV